MSSPTSTSALPDFSTTIPQFSLQSQVLSFLNEDIPSFDFGSLTIGTRPSTANLYLKESGVFAGRPWFDAVFAALGQCVVHWSSQVDVDTYNALPESDRPKSYIPTLSTEGFEHKYTGTPLLLATVTGPINLLLRGERVSLNILSRCSGIATTTSQYVKQSRSPPDTHTSSASALKFTPWKGRVAATRKTTPGFRNIEKYGVLVGGGDTHRLDLSHLVMLKDNHVWGCENSDKDAGLVPSGNKDDIGASHGAITRAITKTKTGSGFTTKIEVECRNLEEATEACQAGADIIMLDNYTPARILEDASILKSKFPHVLLEASGGINIDTIRGFCVDGVDVVSVGKLTQGYGCLDLSFKVQRE